MFRPRAELRSLVAVPVLLFWLVPTVARAAWPHEPTNGNVPLCTAAGDQSYPGVVSDGAGGAIVTWRDLRGGNLDIYAQRVNAAGVPQWTGNGVVLCTAAGDQTNPTIVSDGAGGAIVTWHDFRSASSYDIYAQRVSAAGVPQWTGNGVALCTAANNQSTPTIVSDGAGGAIVSWFDLRNGGIPDIYAQRVNAAGVPQWPGNGVALCTAANSQYFPTMISDGAGGAIVTWYDYRSGSNYDIYAQRVNAAGVPQWTGNGVALCTAAGEQSNPAIVSDGAGGAIVTWNDNRDGSSVDVYAQRVTAAGAPQWMLHGVPVSTASSGQSAQTIVSDGVGGAIVTWHDERSGSYKIYAQRIDAWGLPQWTINGVALCTAPLGQYYPTIVSDGAGGAIVTWHDDRNEYDIYTQRVDATGVPQWTGTGVALCSVPRAQVNPMIVSDGAGGAIVTWFDYRSGTNYDIYAQRVERFGKLGNPEPVIVKVRDVPNEQGGKVNLQWTASYLDVEPGNLVDDYWIWRQVPTTFAQSALREGAALFDVHDAGGTPRQGALRTSVQGDQIYYWEYVGSQVAHGFPGYSYTTSTFADSVAGSNPFTYFMVEAEQNSTGYYWGSAPDSGYSVDNLPPASPASFTASYSAGTTFLHWAPNTEPDFALYRLHRGTSPAFEPAPANLVATMPDTGYVDTAGQPYFYKLAAQDIHGNLSLFVLVQPSGTTGVDGASLPGDVFLAAPNPNPSHGTTVVSFGLPREGRAWLALFDLQGRRVRDLRSGTLAAGEHVASWDGRDNAGQLVPSGIYFVRLEAAGRTRTQRLITIQ